MSLFNSYKEEVVLKTKGEILRLERAGGLAARVLQFLSSYVRPGMNGLLLEKICRRRIEALAHLGRIEKFPDFPSFLSVSINDTVVHGVPNDRPFRGGDLVTLDLVLSLDGWYGDTAITIPVGTLSPPHARLLHTAKRACYAGITAARAGRRFGDIGAAVEKCARDEGLTVFECFAGHGVGRELHEGPTVYMRGEYQVGRPIVPGMVFSVEPVFGFGCQEYYVGEDGHSLKSKDASYTALFEHTVAILSDRTVVLTDPNRHEISTRSVP
ncbi:MAG TPA: type I methionyl aminopeptidase [Sediminispirochaeta sp.]|nr:type I methionyl aminopeptidase [Sediminispirochaeta sp.]